jgi:hypothetical protein
MVNLIKKDKHTLLGGLVGCLVDIIGGRIGLMGGFYGGGGLWVSDEVDVGDVR